MTCLKLALFFLFMRPCQAQPVTVTGNIPYAKALPGPDGTLNIWSLTDIRRDKDDTVNVPQPEGMSIIAKDDSARLKMLGYHSKLVEKTKGYADKNKVEKIPIIPQFSGTLDMTGAVLPAIVAILVDDKATLTVTEDVNARPPGVTGPAFVQPYRVDGTALWNPRSYKEFDVLIPPGRKYNLTLDYENVANLTEKYGGKTDVDGVSVYLCLSPIEVEVPASIQSNLGTDANTEKPVVTYKKASELNIATWENSFEHIPYEKRVRWWIRNDIDHFRVHIPRPDKKGAGSIKITVETKHSAALSAYDDPESDVELTETPANSGEFETVVMLVADDIDKAISPNELKKAAVGGDVIIRYAGNQSAKLKLKEKGRIRIRPLNLWYHAWTGGYAAVTPAKIAADVRDIRERMAQAGITVEWDGDDWGIDVDKVTGASSGFRSGSVGTYGSGGPSTDEAALSAYITKEWPSLSTTSAHDVVIVYTKNIYHDNGGGFFTDNAYGYTLYPSLSKKLGVRTLSVIASERDLHTAAHEVLHVLLDDLHPPAKGGKHDVEFSYSRRLWSGGGIPGLGGGDADAYTDRKRMSKTVPDYVIPGVPGSPGILNSSFVQPPTTTP